MEVLAGGAFERWPARAWASGQGLTVKPSRDKGRLTVTAAANARPGTYWLRLFDDEGASSLRPFLVGTLPEVLEQEPNDDLKKPQLLASSAVTVNGRLEKPGDVDCFALKLKKGQTLVASMVANQTLGSPMDALLQVLSADGFVLEHNHDYHGLDPQIVFPVPKDGTYIVRAFAFPASPDSSIRFAGGETFIYRLTLRTDGFADHAFPLAVTRSAPHSVRLKGWNIPDNAGKLTVGKDEEPSALHSSIVRCGSPFGVVELRVEPHPTLVQNKENDRQHPQTIAIPVTISGCLEHKGDVHVYRFEAKKGQKVNFQAEAQSLGFPLNPVLRLTDAAGKTITRVEGPAPGRDPDVLAFQSPRDGTYQIELRDLHADGGPRYLYRLRAVAPEPDFELTLPADRFVLTPGKVQEVPVTVERRNGFDREIEIVAESLPEGVTAAPATLAAGAKAGILRLTGTKQGSCAIRILGRAKGKTGLARVARAPIVGLNESTSDLWLTVLR